MYFFGAACLVRILLHFPPCRCELEWSIFHVLIIYDCSKPRGRALASIYLANATGVAEHRQPANTTARLLLGSQARCKERGPRAVYERSAQGRWVAWRRFRRTQDEPRLLGSA